MNVIHALGYYFPDTSGGTEVYVNGLVKALRSHNIEGHVAAARLGEQDATYQHDGIDVYRYPVFPNSTTLQLRQIQPHGGFDRFTQWLKQQQADLYHQHTWRSGCNWHHFQAAHQLGLPTVLTIHMPDVLCLRGTMMLEGKTPCDGWIDVARCGKCSGAPERVSGVMAKGLSRVPAALSVAIETKLLATPSVRLRQLGRAVGIFPQVSAYRHRLLTMAQKSDRIIAISQWLYDALLRNGIPEKKLFLCRQGIAGANLSNLRQKLDERRSLKIGFLGRWDATKGVDLLAEAVHRLSADVPVTLVIHGMLQNQYGIPIRDRVLTIAAQDSRIQVKEPLSRSDVPQALAEFDLLAVPSQWLEMAPLVVLEAQDVGTPVLGSNLGGIAEFVRHGVDGWLVEAADVGAWTQAIDYLAKTPDVLAKLRSNLHPVRKIDAVASDMATVYADILRARSSTF